MAVSFIGFSAADRVDDRESAAGATALRTRYVAAPVTLSALRHGEVSDGVRENAARSKMLGIRAKQRPRPANRPFRRLFVARYYEALLHGSEQNRGARWARRERTFVHDQDLEVGNQRSQREH
jgi:hypothetical protein